MSIFTKIDDRDRDRNWYHEEELAELRLSTIKPEDDYYISSQFTINGVRYEYVYVMFPGITMVGLLEDDDQSRLIDPFYLNPNQETNSIDFLGFEGITGAIPSPYNVVELKDSTIIIRPRKISLTVMQQYLRQIHVSYEFRTKSHAELHADYVEMQKALEEEFEAKQAQAQSKEQITGQGVEVQQAQKSIDPSSVAEGVLINSH